MVERVLQRRMIAVAPIDVSKTGMMLLNNAVALVPMSLLLVAFGEPSRWHVVRVRRDGEMRGDAGGDAGRYMGRYGEIWGDAARHSEMARRPGAVW